MGRGVRRRMGRARRTGGLQTAGLQRHRPPGHAQFVFRTNGEYGERIKISLAVTASRVTTANANDRYVFRKLLDGQRAVWRPRIGSVRMPIRQLGRARLRSVRGGGRGVRPRPPSHTRNRRTRPTRARRQARENGQTQNPSNDCRTCTCDRTGYVG